MAEAQQDCREIREYGYRNLEKKCSCGSDMVIFYMT